LKKGEIKRKSNLKKALSTNSDFEITLFFEPFSRIMPGI